MVTEEVTRILFKEIFSKDRLKTLMESVFQDVIKEKAKEIKKKKNAPLVDEVVEEEKEEEEKKKKPKLILIIAVIAAIFLLLPEEKKEEKKKEYIPLYPEIIFPQQYNQPN